MSEPCIKTYPNSVLRKKSRSISDVGEGEKKLISQMVETMYETHGIGLAAPQIGISKNIIVVDIGKGLLKMANPKIVSKKGLTTLEEGCLSVPKKSVNVERASEVTVSYIDENGSQCKKTFRNLAARVIQHEIDHLNGKLIIDYLPWYKRIFSKRVNEATTYGAKRRKL